VWKRGCCSVTLPGMPYVIVGHNQRIAGVTNVGPTVADAFIENFNAQERIRRRRAGSSRSIAKR